MDRTPSAEAFIWFLQGKGIFTGALAYRASNSRARGNQAPQDWLLLWEGLAAMLVLSRKKNESIVINNDITVTVVEIRGDKVRLGIVAPKEVPVHRQEVYEAIHGKDTAEPPAAPPMVVKSPPS
jgi:carbon storage regulator